MTVTRRLVIGRVVNVATVRHHQLPMSGQLAYAIAFLGLDGK